MRSVLFGVSPFDPIAFIGAALLLIGTAALATLAPTYRLLREDPVHSLRYE